MLMPMTRYQRQMTWKKRAETDGRALALSVTTQARPPDGWRGRDDGSEPRWRRWHVELSRWLSSRLHFVLDILVVVNFRATFWPEHSPLQASPCRLHCYCCCCCWRRLLQRQLSSASSTLHRPYSALLNITDPTHVRPTDLTFYSLSRRRLVNGLQHASSLGYFFDKYYIKLHFKVNSRKQLPNKTSTDYWGKLNRIVLNVSISK